MVDVTEESLHGLSLTTVHICLHLDHLKRAPLSERAMVRARVAQIAPRTEGARLERPQLEGSYAQIAAALRSCSL